MTIRHIVWAIVLGFVGPTSIVHAVPTGGAATGITSNQFNVSVTGSDGGDVWVAWGTAAGAHPWASGYYTGDGSIQVYGAPIIGGSKIYYVACDTTGCDPTERSLTIAAITSLPTPNFGIAYRNMSNRHFAIDTVVQNLLPGYTANGMSSTLLWGIMFFFIVFGFWFRDKKRQVGINSCINHGDIYINTNSRVNVRSSVDVPVCSTRINGSSNGRDLSSIHQEVITMKQEMV